VICERADLPGLSCDDMGELTDHADAITDTKRRGEAFKALLAAIEDLPRADRAPAFALLLSRFALGPSQPLFEALGLIARTAVSADAGLTDRMGDLQASLEGLLSA